MTGPIEVRNRRESRFSFVSEVKFAAQPEAGGEEFEGLAFNVSLNGMCLSVDTPLAVGQEVFIKECILPHCRKVYTVQWVDRTDSGKYAIGLVRKNIDVLPQFA